MKNFIRQSDYLFLFFQFTKYFNNIEFLNFIIRDYNGDQYFRKKFSKIISMKLFNGKSLNKKTLIKSNFIINKLNSPRFQVAFNDIYQKKIKLLIEESEMRIKNS